MLCVRCFALWRPLAGARYVKPKSGRRRCGLHPPPGDAERPAGRRAAYDAGPLTHRARAIWSYAGT